MRVFLDANVLFTAAHNPEGLSQLLFDLGRHQVLPLISSQLAVEEARSNLLRKASESAPRLDSLVPLLEIVATPSTLVALENLPDDDRLIFGAALAGGATHLLTGDKRHFGPYFDRPTRTHGVRIQTVRRFFSDQFGVKP